MAGVVVGGETVVEGLRLDNVSHKYRKTDFLLSVDCFSGSKGEVICLLGPSGCGKSTILKLIAGLERLRTGTITVNGRTLSDVQSNIHIPTEKRNVGLVFQHPSLFHHQTVEENVAFAIRDQNRERKAQQALHMLNLLNMAGYKDAYPHMLSGGQQQLVTIARTMAQRPEIFLLDEPFSNLDAILRSRIRTEVLSIIRRERITTLLVTHDPEEALEVADKIYIISEGRIVRCGTPSEIYNNPKDVHLAQFFGKSNYFESVVHDMKVQVAGVGNIDASSFGNGNRVAVYIQPEAITLQQSGGTQAMVKLVRFFNSMIYIEVSGCAYWMKFTGSVLPEVGDVISVSFDFSKVSLFRL
ncbi:ABC transporter ATP-binding protein [Anaplasma capra]|uniref:ABC transporter ATP-binding protein n=1 Tax=Anaplasma capra TaxID=1562740 RepID=UPI0021D5AF20|nr:ABC transporter ATP-binding protein [Anaplasma capra]MCU7611412.1 ABC transporter ATP-binding protein [Anaplasma capra]MCU7612149.1 ABC transporter ATP-binding protein [Anaplasma capra]